MKFPKYPVILLLLFGSHSAIAGSSSQDDATQAAKEFVRQGTAEYTKQHWEAARVSFLKAWELKQHYAIAANLGDVELKLGRYREAAEHLKYTLANLPPERAEKRADAEASLKECRAHLSAVRVSVSVVGAVVKLDGQDVPPGALSDELLLEPGPTSLKERSQDTSSRRAIFWQPPVSRARFDLSYHPNHRQTQASWTQEKQHPRHRRTRRAARVPYGS